MPNTFITDRSRQRRSYWTAEIRKLSGAFGDDAQRMEAELKAEILEYGIDALLDHLRLCGAIPELYQHDSSEEKLYSKYTDAILAEAFSYLGITSVVLRERGDSADVEGVTKDYSFVADAKAFRLSRTAKNQKDFKINAMNVWKRGKPFAIVVCPLYQLPAKSSQIYQQAIAHDVCIFSYSHLAVLLRASVSGHSSIGSEILNEVLKGVALLNPTKQAPAYWAALNNTMLNAHGSIRALWQEEKIASIEALAEAKEEALFALAAERAKIMGMSKDEAIAYLITKGKFQAREKIVKAISPNGLMDCG